MLPEAGLSQKRETGLPPTMAATRRRTRLRDTLSDREILRPAPILDPLTARLAEVEGHEIAMMAGSMASLALLGAPDIALITLSELAEHVRRISRVSDMSLIVDADHGFGNSLNVMRTIEELEWAGASAVTIEDTNLPSPFDGKGISLVEVEEGVAKMKAAVRARQDPRFVIIGRTGAPRLDDDADTMRRVVAYAESGVDALFLSGVKSRDLLDEIASKVRIPIIIGAASEAIQEMSYLRSRGVRIWLHGHEPVMRAMEALSHSYSSLIDAPTEASQKQEKDARTLMRDATREDQFNELARAFLTSDPSTWSAEDTSRH